MTLREKIAEKLWDNDNQGAWETFEDLWPADRQPYLEQADEILKVMSTHFGIR